MFKLLVSIAAFIIFGYAMAEDAMFVPAPGSPIKAGGSPGASLVVDINADGAADLIVPNLKLGYAQIYLGDNTGQFKLLPGSTLKTSGMMVVLDANEDGKLDI